jgi:hypothetical protein
MFGHDASHSSQSQQVAITLAQFVLAEMWCYNVGTPLSPSFSVDNSTNVYFGTLNGVASINMLNFSNSWEPPAGEAAVWTTPALTGTWLTPQYVCPRHR